MTLAPLRPKTLIRRAALSDPFTNSLYSFGPYRGCAHACSYCDGRAEKYYVEGDFGSDIGYRENLAELLEAELPRLRERDAAGRRPMLSLGSGVTDSYQPAEADKGLVRRAARILLEAGQPVFLITKSSLVMRDIDIWSELNARAGFVLVMTVAMADEGMREIYEPGASPIRERLKTLKSFAEAGCPTGMLGMPLLPGLTDGEADLRALYAAAHEAGVSFFMPGGLTLRPGRQKEHFLRILAAERPDLLPRYAEIYGEERVSGRPRAKDLADLDKRLASVAADMAGEEEKGAPGSHRGAFLPVYVPHRILRRIVPEYEALHILFLQMQELFSREGVDVRPLHKAAARYAAWLETMRKEFNRRRTLPRDWIDAQFDAIKSGGGLEDLLGNDRLAAFAREILSGAEFDYRSRRAVRG